MHTPSFSPQLFWDTDTTRIDWHGQAEAVLTRVFNRGSLEDVIKAASFYGKAPIQALLRQSDTLSPEGRRLAALVVNIF